MINLPSLRKKTELEEVRTEALSALEGLSPTTDEYKATMKQIKVLSELIDAERPDRLNPNTILTVLGNVSIAGLILWHEREHVITTKMFPFLGKGNK